MIIYSLVLILVMLYRPTGLMGTKEITDLFKFGKKGGMKCMSKLLLKLKT